MTDDELLQRAADRLRKLSRDIEWEYGTGDHKAEVIADELEGQIDE